MKVMLQLSLSYYLIFPPKFLKKALTWYLQRLRLVMVQLQNFNSMSTSINAEFHFSAHQLLCFVSLLLKVMYLNYMNNVTNSCWSYCYNWVKSSTVCYIKCIS